MRTLAINAFAIIASLLAMMNLLMTSAYTARAPQGSDAMGLIIPLGASIISALCLLAGTGLALSGGRLAWIDPRPGVAAAVAMLVALGVGALIVCALVAWSGRGNSWAAPVGIIGAGIAPFLLSALLMMSRSAQDGVVASAPMPRWAAGVLVPVACVGVALGMYFLAGALRDSADRAASTARANVEFEAKWDSIRNRSPVEAARADMAAMDPAAPLWAVIGALPETENTEARDIIIERGFAVPSLNDEVATTLASQYPRYRYASLLFIQHMNAARRQESWAPLVAQAIDSTAAEIGAQPTWFEADATRNPKPVEFVRALGDAPSLFAGSTAIATSLGKLKTVIAAAPAGAARDSALARLNESR